jgi:opacity protein-like surface antigen
VEKILASSDKGKAMKKRIFLIAFILFLCAAHLFYGAEKKDIGAAGKPKEKVVQKSDKAPFKERFQPRIGILPGFAVPVGDVGPVLNTGFSGSVFGDFSLPISFLKKSGLVLRGGVSFGYAPFNSSESSAEAKVSLVPILVYTEVSYPLKFGLSPLVHIGVGGSIANLKDESGSANPADESSFDGTFQIAAGAGYSLKSLPQLEFLLNIGLLSVFEEVNGNFFYTVAGVSYKL